LGAERSARRLNRSSCGRAGKLNPNPTSDPCYAAAGALKSKAALHNAAKATRMPAFKWSGSFPIGVVIMIAMVAA